MTLSTIQTASQTAWQTVPVDYDQGTVIHVWPNQVGHTESMSDGQDCWCKSDCTCGVSYDLADDGTVMVIHELFGEETKP